MALSPGERVRLIQGAAQGLAGMQRVDAELALDQFGLEDIPFAGRSWASYAYEYVIGRLKSATDETLLNLNAHLAGDSPVAPDAGPWKADHIRVFLSHTSASRRVAREIRDRLLGEGIDLFVAHDVIETDQEWIEEIRVGLATSETLVALFSEDFLHSKWCDQEVGHALGRGIKVISIMYGAAPHGFVYPKQGFEVSPDDTNASTRIAQEICRLVKGEDPSTIPDPATAVVRKYVRSHSYDEARKNVQRLLKLKATDWTPELVEMAEAAGSDNSQLSDAYWFEDLVPDLLTEHLREIGVPPTAGAPVASRSPDIPL